MPSTRYARGRGPLARGAAVLVLLGGAGALAFASPAAARVLPAQAPSLSGPFSVFLVLPTSSGLTSSKTAKTSEPLSAFSLSTTAQAASGLSTGTGAGAAKTTSQVTATMAIDTVSTNLLEDVFGSHVLNPVEVVFDKTTAGKQATFLTYEFKNCIITSYQLQDGPGTQPQATSGPPSVQITFVFQALSLSFGPGAKASGTGAAVPAGWDITTNKAV
jgi:type VI protein secretion system component Hcp